MALRCFIKKILLQIQILMTFKLCKVNMHQQGNDEHEKVTPVKEDIRYIETYIHTLPSLY